MQNAAFSKLRIDSVYVPFRVPRTLLQDAVQGFRSQNLLGFNVTIPHKVTIVKYLDQMNHLARNIGAVNTVANINRKLVGYNTDASGAIQALKHGGVRLDDSICVILGAGGAARAIVYALAEETHRIIVLNRSLEKAHRLKEDVKRRLRREIQVDRLTRSVLGKTLPRANVLINATSVGMEGKEGTLPVEESCLRREITVFDIVYGPSETDLLRKARRSSCRTINGIEMLLHQGAAAFETWTGKKAPLNTMRDALLRAVRI